MYRSQSELRNFGMTIIELLVAIGILAVLFVITTRIFKTTNSSKALDTDVQRIIAELNEARSLTLSSENADQFGVHFASSSVTLFEGTSFVTGGATNTVTSLNPLVQISSIKLAGNSADVIFQRLSGETSQDGTVTVSRVADTLSSKTITIHATGVTDVY